MHGARATRRWVERRTDSRSQGRRGWRKRRGGTRTAGAGAHKTARSVWALLRRGGVYSETAGRPQRVTADTGEDEPHASGMAQPFPRTTAGP
jgi:hypothetical protein